MACCAARRHLWCQQWGWWFHCRALQCAADACFEKQCPPCAQTRRSTTVCMLRASDVSCGSIWGMRATAAKGQHEWSQTYNQTDNTFRFTASCLPHLNRRTTWFDPMGCRAAHKITMTAAPGPHTAAPGRRQPGPSCISSSLHPRHHMLLQQAGNAANAARLSTRLQ